MARVIIDHAVDTKLGCFLVALAILMSRNGSACFNSTPTAETISNNLQFLPTTGSGITNSTSTAATTTSSTTTTSTTTASTQNIHSCYDPTTLDNKFGTANPFRCTTVTTPCTSFGSNYIEYPSGALYTDMSNCEETSAPSTFLRCHAASSVICRPSDINCRTTETKVGATYADTNTCLRGVDISAAAFCNCEGTCTQLVQDNVCCVPPLTQTGGDGIFYVSPLC